MTSLVDLLNLFKGYRTYLASAATILSSVATVAGFIDPTCGTAISAACIGVAQVFHRMASADHQESLLELMQDFRDLSADIKPLLPAQPNTVPMNK